MKYVTRALVIFRDEFGGEQIIGGETVFEPEDRAVKTGLLNAAGNPIWRIPERVAMGFRSGRGPNEAAIPPCAAELDERSGLGEAELAKIKRNAELIMADIDAAPAKWRALVNDYHIAPVALLAHAGLSCEAARAVLERQFGKPI